MRGRDPWARLGGVKRDDQDDQDTAAPGDPAEGYLPIAEHGLIGDLRTSALVGTNGRIDWFCAPRFDSPSVFAALLDKERGGFWDIAPVCDSATRNQFYFPDTNILITRILTADGIVEVQDFMPIVRERDTQHRQRLVRRVVNVRGRMRLGVRIAPRLNYGRDRHRLERIPDGVRFVGDSLTLWLRSSITLDLDATDAHAEFDLPEGRRRCSTWRRRADSTAPRPNPIRARSTRSPPSRSSSPPSPSGAAG